MSAHGMRYIDTDSMLFRALILIGIISAITITFFLIFSALGLLTEEGLRAFIESDDVVYMYIIYIALFVIQAACLSFIPGSTALFCGVGLLLFGYDAFWTVVVLNIIAAWIVSQTIFFIGRYGGRRLLKILFGKNGLDKQLNVLSKKGTKILPVWFSFCVLPDDMMCLACGSSEMDWKRFTIIHTIFRTFGITTLTAIHFFVLPMVLPMLGW